MDGNTSASIAALVASIAALISAAGSVYVGRRATAAANKTADNLGPLRLVEFREKRLNLLIDAIADLHGLISILPRRKELPKDLEKAYRAFARVKLLANLNENETKELFVAYEKLDKSKNDQEFDSNADTFLRCANALISKEWQNLQADLMKNFAKQA